VYKRQGLLMAYPPIGPGISIMVLKKTGPCM
jgi:hypothetical protein